jgi:hypothetical protein
MDDFPYPKMGKADMTTKGKGEWFWESGFNKHPINDLELIRDWNLRAVFGAFNAMKNRDGKPEHLNAKLDWVAYVGGTRESRRIVGDVMLTHEDIITKKQFPDGCVPSTWSIDLHFAKKEFATKFSDNPFISYAEHDRRIDRDFGYPIPYRCLYSVNIENMFMAGRNISVTDQALGTVRVMKTIGMMGEVVGKAAAVAIQRNTTPRGVYEKHWSEVDSLLKLPGRARRATLEAPFQISGPVPGPLTTPAAAAAPLASPTSKVSLSTTKPRSSPAPGIPAPASNTSAPTTPTPAAPVTPPPSSSPSRPTAVTKSASPPPRTKTARATPPSPSATPTAPRQSP